MSYLNEFDNTQVDVAALGNIGRLRQLVGGYCPEEIRREVAPFVPTGVDELNLDGLRAEFDNLLAGKDVWTGGLPKIEGLEEFPTNWNSAPQTSTAGNIPTDDSAPQLKPDTQGFGIGIPEIDKVSMINYEETDTIDSRRVRSDFPVLNQQVNGKPLVWFDNGATTQKPQAVIDAISHFYEHDNSNIHRGAHCCALA